MFYDTAKLDIALLCKHCGGRLDIPKILPCGKTICSFCEKSIQVNENKFDCLVCKEKHDMLKNGLVTSEALLEILSIKQTNVSRGRAFDQLKNLLDNIQYKRNYIKLGIENGTDLVKEHCIELRSDVQLKS